jgi:DUF4097 and DUF4098 domain-containing protein YvlB
MMKMALIPAVALLTALAVPAPAAAQETERVDRTASIRAGGTLRVKNFSGHVTITAGNRGDVVIHAVRRASRERLDHIKLDVRETSSGVTIEANKRDDNWEERDNNVVDTEMEIQVPADVKLDVEVFSSDVRVTGVRGDQNLHTFSGDIEVADAEGSIDAETFSGGIELKLAQNVGGKVDFDSFSGSLRADGGMTTQSSSRRRVTGTIGNGGNNNYHFKTFSGSVKIR